ncbi:hypothetical protein BXU09_19380 [Deinococcus sp. LM3]|nr:hypothetical protein BXU09_19380 [Deinococcus sp. LM3]
MPDGGGPGAAQQGRDEVAGQQQLQSEINIAEAREAQFRRGWSVTVQELLDVARFEAQLFPEDLFRSHIQVGMHVDSLVTEEGGEGTVTLRTGTQAQQTNREWAGRGVRDGDDVEVRAARPVEVTGIIGDAWRAAQQRQAQCVVGGQAGQGAQVDQAGQTVIKGDPGGMFAFRENFGDARAVH